MTTTTLPSIQESVLTFERNFDTLLFDSIEFLLDAFKLHPDAEKCHSLARASIVFSCLLLEAVANICIEHLHLEKAIHKEVDRLPFLSKFDFYLRTKFSNKKFERGMHQAEWANEIKNIRDGLVHLKVTKVVWQGNFETGATSEATRTKLLKIATNPSFWSSDDALAMAKGVHEFLAFFFKEKCKYSPTKVATLLFSHDEIPGSDSSIPCVSKQTKNKLKELGLDISYIKVIYF